MKASDAVQPFVFDFFQCGFVEFASDRSEGEASAFCRREGDGRPGCEVEERDLEAELQALRERQASLKTCEIKLRDVRAADELLSKGLQGAKHLIADKGYDANAFRESLREQGTRPVIPSRSNRKRKITYNKARYRERHLVENAFCRLKDFRRIATRYDKLGRNFLSAVAVATVVAFWI